MLSRLFSPLFSALIVAILPLLIGGLGCNGQDTRYEQFAILGAQGDSDAFSPLGEDAASHGKGPFGDGWSALDVGVDDAQGDTTDSEPFGAADTGPTDTAGVETGEIGRDGEDGERGPDTKPSAGDEDALATDSLDLADSTDSADAADAEQGDTGLGATEDVGGPQAMDTADDGPDAASVMDSSPQADVADQDTGPPPNEGAVAPDGLAIQWCRLWHPATFTAYAGDTHEVGVHLYLPGLTDVTEDGPDPANWLRAEVGYAPIDVDPSLAPDDFVWQDAFADDAPPSFVFYKHDRYLGDLSIPEVGLFDYAARFSIDQGQSWTYCDLDGNQDGYEVEESGRAEILTPPTE